MNFTSDVRSSLGAIRSTERSCKQALFTRRVHQLERGGAAQVGKAKGSVWGCLYILAPMSLSVGDSSLSEELLGDKTI